ncbi:MAG: Radical domain protein [Acidobacteriaceae bacterium]|nr:Radical domain protein [Acidobacteriaceae bacterium]
MSPLIEIQPVARESARMSHLPILILNLHTNCNCRCVMCDIWKRPDHREFPAGDLERHRESLRNLGVQQVVLTGGEPLLHRELPAVLAFFRAQNIRITLLTSGLLLRKHAQLLATHVDEVILSLDGPAEIHNQIRRIPRAFELIAQGIQALRVLNPTLPIAARTTVQKQNHTHLRATVATAHSLGLDSISFLPADLSSQAFNRDQPWNLQRREEVALNHEELGALHAEIELLIATHQLDIRNRFIQEGEPKLRRLAERFREYRGEGSPRAPLCNAPWVSTVMEADGSLRPCFFHLPVATTAYQTLEQAINSPSARIFRKDLDVAKNSICKRCVCSLNLAAPAD